MIINNKHLLFREPLVQPVVEAAVVVVVVSGVEQELIPADDSPSKGRWQSA